MLPMYCISALEQTQAIVRDYFAEKKKIPVCSIFHIKETGFHIAHFPEDVHETVFFTTSISFANVHKMSYFISVHTCRLIEEGGQFHLPRTREDLNNESASKCVVVLIYQRLGQFKFGCKSIWASGIDEEEGILSSWYEYDALNFQKKI